MGIKVSLVLIQAKVSAWERQTVPVKWHLEWILI